MKYDCILWEHMVHSMLFENPIHGYMGGGPHYCRMPCDAEKVSCHRMTIKCSQYVWHPRRMYLMQACGYQWAVYHIRLPSEALRDAPDQVSNWYMLISSGKNDDLSWQQHSLRYWHATILVEIESWIISLIDHILIKEDVAWASGNR